MIKEKNRFFHPWMNDWPDWKHRAWYKLMLYQLANFIKKGGALTPEQQSCKEAEEIRTGKPQYDVAHYNKILERAKSIEP